MSVTIEDLLAKIERDLERPTAGYVLFTRFEAQFLHDEVTGLMKQLDELREQQRQGGG